MAGVLLVCAGFNLSPDAHPLATPNHMNTQSQSMMFQSQSRSQSSVDYHHVPSCSFVFCVSISVEKPILWRPRRGALARFLSWCFNLSREANPLATLPVLWGDDGADLFQSQSRSQSS